MPNDSLERVSIIDALRGSALFGILMLHAEHWGFVRDPVHRPAWLVKLDQQVFESAYFFFGGKAYAIFALMFDISFFITLDRWNGKSRNASGRFLCRLVLLGALGYVHSVRATCRCATRQWRGSMSAGSMDLNSL